MVVAGQYILTLMYATIKQPKPSFSGAPGAVNNIRVETDLETVTVLWDAAPSNGADISLYTVTVFLDSEQVYTGTSAGTSLSVLRNEFQNQEDIGRDIEYQVTVSAMNSVDTGEEVSVMITIPSGVCSCSESVCTCTHRTPRPYI